MQETKLSSYFRQFWVRCLRVALAALVLSFPAYAGEADEIADSPSPILISQADSTRALAANADTFRGTFPRKSPEAFEPGGRVTLFVTNLDLMADEAANAFRVYAEDADGKQFRFVVERIAPLRKQDWIYAVTIRLYDQNERNGQPEANGDVLIRLTWRGMTSNRVRLGLGTTGGKIKDDEGAAPTPAPTEKPAQTSSFAMTGGDRVRFMEQAAFGPTAAIDLRLRQVGYRRWIEEQINKPYPSIAYPDMPQMPGNVSTDCGNNIPVNCVRDHYSQYLNQNWMAKEALYGDDQLRRRVSWALHQIWVVSGVDTQQQRWEQEYIEILDRNAFTNWRTMMGEMTLNPAMGNYLDMIRSTRTNPNENYPREILQLFAVGLYQLNQDGTLQMQPDPNNPGQQIPIPTYDQDKVNNFTKVFTGWTFCSNNTVCPNIVLGAPNYVDPMLLVSSQHDLTAKTLFNYTQVNGQPAPFSTIPACTGCTTDATRVPYANNSLNQTLDNIYYHPNVAPFVSTLLIQHLVTSDPSPAYVGRVSAVFNNNRTNPTQMREVVKAILLDPEARGTIKNDPNYGKLREPFQLATNILRHFNAKSADGTQQSDGYIAPQTAAMGQNPWNPPTVFNYFTPDYVVPGTDVLGPEFAITNTGTSFTRINFVNTMVYGRINCTGSPTCQPNGNAPVGTSISLAEPTAWATADPSGNTLIEGLNTKMMHGAMSQGMKDRIRTAISVTGMTAAQKAQGAVYLVASSSQYQVQK